MRILLLSDISWRLTSFDLLQEKSKETKPSLVLLAGDLAEQGGADAWSSLYEFVNFLDEYVIQTYFIKGNWDDNTYYAELVEMTKRLPHVEEISDRVVEFSGVKILGVPFFRTSRLKTAKRITELFPEPVDIVLAHAQLTRRIWLFGLKTRFVITGHYDTQLCQIRDKVFISLGQFPADHAIMELSMTGWTVTYHEHHLATLTSEPSYEDRVSKASILGGRFIWETEPVRSRRDRISGVSYASIVETLMASKKQVDGGSQNRSEITQRLLREGVPRKHVQEYIGGT